MSATDPTAAMPTTVHSPSGWGAAWMLARREWVRFFRQRNRVTAAVVQPLLFWLLFGTGLRGSFEGAGGQDFIQFFLPGTVALIVLFTAIFATISVIEDRREGFMQAVLVAPVGRWPVLAGKVIGGGAIAWVQAVFFLTLVYAFGTAPLSFSIFPLMLLLAVLALSMCGLGMIVAWPMDSTQGFHAIMMLGLMPMWLMSGAFFPVPAAGEESLAMGQTVLRWVMLANPLTYGLAEMRHLLYPAVDFAEGGFAPDSVTNWIVSVLFMVAMLSIAWYLMRGSKKADLVA
ncbi:ABC transporter permease [Roseimaritima multifibrata]|nr:ABC transporter permease [Roseimaritima multifibrata]